MEQHEDRVRGSGGEQAPLGPGRRALQVLQPGRVEYGRALALQEELLQRKIDGDQTDYLVLLEHDPVYTLGRGADEQDLLGAPERLGIPVFRVGRGGGATYHGPGQFVAYPIVRLFPHSCDVHRYVRALEQTIVDTCAAFGVAAGVRSGLTGVWAGEEKLASIGIGVRRGISYHGIALNVSTDTSPFERICACRLPELRVTSLERRLGVAPAMAEVARVFAGCFGGRFGLRVIPAAEGAWR